MGSVTRAGYFNEGDTLAGRVNGPGPSKDASYASQAAR